jgi:flavin-dependent trigonelline monooxygenase, reductase component
MTKLDPRALRTAFGSFMTGVTVVTALRDDGTPVGFTANSFSSVSLDPPLLLVCPGKFLSSYGAFAKCTHFVVNILAEGQEEISNTFAGFKGDRFAITRHSLNADGVPLIDHATAQFSCKTRQVHPAGDHAILIGEVTEFRHEPRPALGYLGGQYFSRGLEGAAFDQTSGTAVCGAIIEDGDRVLLERTPQGLCPPQCTTINRGRLIAELQQTLEAKGITAELGQAYSVFEGRRDRVQYSYFLAIGQRLETASDIVSVPTLELPAQTYPTSAIAQMMTRFAVEAQTRSFALYLGDTEDGAIQRPPKRT